MSAALVGVVAMASGCASSSGDQASALNGPPAASTSTGPTKPAPNIDPIAPPYTPVVRNGVVPTPHFRAKHEPFSKPVSYSDQVSVAILGIRQGVTQGHGPGEIAGRPVTTTRIRFFNGSAKPVDLNAVVITVVYGSQPRLASAVYQDSSSDFQGTIAPGHSSVATYSFSVPTSELGQVTMRVDFDGLHAAATFTGSVT